MDGTKDPIQLAEYIKIQNTDYHSIQFGHCFAYTFDFAVEDTIPVCCFKITESTHDSTATDFGFIYDKQKNG